MHFSDQSLVNPKIHYSKLNRFFTYTCSYFFFFLFQSAPETDDTTTYGDAKGNVTELDSPAPVSSQKYSLILGDNSTFNRNSYSHNTFKSRGHYNKENYYNQRGRPSWQRGTSYKSPIVNGKEEKPEKDDKASLTDAKGKSSTEPLKFNEGLFNQLLMFLVY